jgi:hypothetical protein
VSLTKEKIKIILKEEVENFIQEQEGDSGKQLKVLEKLLKAIEGLDVSIDYLAASVSDEDPLTIGLSQATLGRLARAKKRPRDVGPIPAAVPQPPVRQERD